ncbi:MAG: PAS domain S-box protein [Rickettsiales bacterium]
MRFNENEYHDPSRLDFVPREYRRQFVRMIAAFTVCLLALLVVGFIGTIRNSGFSPLLSLFIIIFISMYALIRKQRDIDLVVNTEYQNMLFSQGVALGSSFYMFVRMDGTIAYSSDGLRTLFPMLAGGEAQALASVLEHGGILAPDRDRLMKAITTCSADRMVFPIPANNDKKEYVITVDPLPRPAGMLLVRGREFRDNRSGTQLLPDVLRSTTTEKLDHMLARSPVGHYTADGFGQIEYANRAFEELLGYAPGEATERKLTLAEVIHALHGIPYDAEAGLMETSGDASLRRKQGGQVSVMLFQSLIRDAAGKPTAATGSILPFSATRE